MKRKLLKTLSCFALVLMMANAQTVSAASISSTLSSNAQKVTTTFNSGSSGYHKVIVMGYEYHPQTGNYNYYSHDSSVTGGGNLSVSHASHTGYKFLKSYGQTTLKSVLYLNNAYIGEIKTT